MTYNDILTTINNIINDEQIINDGLTLVYELDSLRHRQLDEELYIKANNTNDMTNFNHQNVFEIEVDGLKVKFIDKNFDM